MTESGWHRDPTGRHELRYWDGLSWTSYVSDAGMTTTDDGGGGPAAPQPPSPPAARIPPPPSAYPPPGAQSASSGKKVPAGICGILLGAFGVHKFILGYTSEALIMLLVSILVGILTCGVATAVMSVIGLIEGIIYLTKTDAEFDSTYVYNKRGWF